MEGSSDKYAKMIGSWLKDLGWVNTERKKVTETFLGKTYSCELQAYKITIKGLKALKRSRSHSSKSGISKRVPFEMLATKVSSPDYFRKRRALIIEALQSGDKDVNQLLRRLNSENIKANESTVIDDINGLIHIGLSVDRKNNGEYHLVDTVVGLKIPQDISTIPDSAVELKNTISEKLKYLNHKYLILVDLAFSDSANKAKKNSDARDFEYQTADLFTKELSYNGMRLGDSLKPDVIISYGNEGVIVDNKSYAKGFNAGVSNTDEMGRYIEDNSNRTPGTPPNEWWKNFNYDVSTFHFLFVSSYITGKLENLKILSKRNNDITGGAIGVESLLYLADKVKGKVLSEKDLFPMMNNGEIVVKPIVEDYKKELLVAEEKVQ